MLRDLFKHSILYFGGLVLVKFLSLYLFILLAEALLPNLFGRLAYFLTLLSLLTLISDWGLIQWFQVKRTAENRSSLLQQILSARLVTLMISALAFIVFQLIFQPFTAYQSAIFLGMLLPEALTSVFDGYYLTKRQSVLIALKQLSKFIIPLLVVMLFSSKLQVEDIMVSFWLSSIFTMLWYFPWKAIGNYHWKNSDVVSALRHSTSYASLIITSAFYSRGDALILKNRLGDTAVGIYSAGYRYLDAMSMFPSAFAQNLFHLSAQKNELSTSKVLQMTATMGVFGLFFGGFLYYFSGFLTVVLLGPAYAGADLIVKIFGVVTVLLFLNSPLSTIVQSSRLVKQFLPWGIGNTILNLGLNVLVIPLFGGIGAALVMLLTEITGLLINVYFVRKRLRHS